MKKKGDEYKGREGMKKWRKRERQEEGDKQGDERDAGERRWNGYTEEREKGRKRRES